MHKIRDIAEMHKYLKANKTSPVGSMRHLHEVDFTGANLQGADFSHIKFTDCTFRRAELERASFCGSIMRQVDFSNASAIGADFALSEIEQCRFFATKLERVNFTQATVCKCDLSEADLSLACFAGAKLHGSVLAAELSYTIFVNVDLTQASGLERAVIESVYVDSSTIDYVVSAQNSGIDVSALQVLLSKVVSQAVKLSGFRSARLPDAPTGLLGAMPDYVVRPGFSDTCLSELSNVLASAQNEAPLQSFLEANPALLLRFLPAHHKAWVIPRPNLGGKYIPDFLACGLSSLGMSWLAIEIESPTQTLFTSRGDPTAALTHAIRQISDWREWLSTYISTARNPVELNGNGLVDIYAELPGLIYIGRDSDELSKNIALRRRLSREHRIEIRTYDALLRRSDDQPTFYLGRPDDV